MDKPRVVSGPLEATALVLLSLETIVTALLTVGYALYAIEATESTRLYWGVTAVMAMFTAGLAFTSWGWVRRKRFAPSAALTWQLLQLSLGVWVLGANVAVGLVMVTAAAVIVVAAMRRYASLAGANRAGD